MSKYQNKTYSMTSKAEQEIKQACKLLDTDNQSYALRYCLSLGVQQLEKQKESA